jgi:AraC family transcriptional regulator
MLNTYIEPRLELLKEKKLLGCKLKMSIINNKTSQLWGQFGPKIKNIKNKFNSDKFSLQVYDAGYHSNFNPENEFEKWALVEVKNFDEIPRGLEPFTLVGGEYAVFDYKGSSSDTRIYQIHFYDMAA